MSALRVAYDTRALLGHRLEDAAALVADAGWDGLLLTLDVHHLDPTAPWLEKRAYALRARLGELGLSLALAADAPYLLDPTRAHRPTLVGASSAGRSRRIELDERAIAAAHVLGAESLTLPVGAPDDDGDGAQRLLEALEPLGDLADRRGVPLALELRAGTVVDGPTAAAALPAGLRVAVDLGERLAAGVDPVAELAALGDRLGAVRLTDARPGGPDGLPLGEGAVDLPAALAALREARFGGLVAVAPAHVAGRAGELVAEQLARVRAAAAADAAA